MRYVKAFLLLLSLIIVSSCKRNNCEDKMCFSPPGTFNFELVDAETGENLITNGTYKADQISIIDQSNNTAVQYGFVSDNNLNIIQLNSIGWKSETINYTAKVTNKDLFNFHVTASRVSEDCCSFTNYSAIKITNAAFQFDQSKGIYKILVN